MKTVTKIRNGKLVEYTVDGVAQPNGTLNPAEVVSNAFRAASRILDAGMRGKRLKVSNEEQSRRITICGQCEFFTGLTCKKCGCHIRWKSGLTTESCPIGKW